MVLTNILSKAVYLWFIFLHFINGEGEEIGECSLSVFDNATYKFNFWVLTPFEDQYKFSRKRTQPTLELAINDTKQKISQVFPEDFLSKLANVSSPVDFFKRTNKTW